MAAEHEELVRRAQEGNREAFEQLVRLYDGRVLSIAATHTSNSEEAKDMYQEIFLRVYQGLPGFQFRSSFSTWLYRIAINVCLDHQKRKGANDIPIDEISPGKGPDRNGPAGALVSSQAADQELLDSELSARLTKALQSLSRQQRLVFTLRHYHGYRLREIASLMNCAEGTVKGYLFTATARMRSQLKDVLE